MGRLFCGFKDICLEDQVDRDFTTMAFYYCNYSGYRKNCIGKTFDRTFFFKNTVKKILTDFRGKWAIF